MRDLEVTRECWERPNVAVLSGFTSRCKQFVGGKRQRARWLNIRQMFRDEVAVCRAPKAKQVHGSVHILEREAIAFEPFELLHHPHDVPQLAVLTGPKDACLGKAKRKVNPLGRCIGVMDGRLHDLGRTPATKEQNGHAQPAVRLRCEELPKPLHVLGNKQACVTAKLTHRGEPPPREIIKRSRNLDDVKKPAGRIAAYAGAQHEPIGRR